MKRLILMAWLGITVSLHAQTSNPLSLTLQQALQMGVDNRVDLKASEYDVATAQNELSKSKKAWIPEIKVEGSLQYNTQLQPTVIPKGILGNNKPEMVQMGSKNVSSLGLSLRQPVFKPGIQTDIEIAKNAMALQKEQLHGKQIAIKNSIATAYLDVLLKRLQYHIARDEAKRFEKYSALAEGKYKNGALIENDYLRAKLDYKNARVKAATTRQNYNLALDYLKYQINVPEQTQLILSDSINKVSFDRNLSDTTHFLVRRTEIKQLQLQQKTNSLQLKRTRQNALPTLSLEGYYGKMYQNENFHYDQSLWWAPHSYVGLRLTVPITDNFINKNNIRKNQIRQKQLDLDLRQERLDVRYQVEKAKTDLQNARKNMRSARENYALSQSIYRNQQQQLDIGVFKYSDLLDTERSLHQAEQNYTRTVYDFLLSEIAYQKALGSL